MPAKYIWQGASAFGLVRTGARIYRLNRAGGYTSNPDDPQYPEYWKMAPGSQSEPTLRVIPGTQRLQGRPQALNQFVNVRVTPENVYFDTIDPPRVGAVGTGLGLAGDIAGINTPRAFPRDQVEIRDVRPGRVAISAPGMTVAGRTDVYVGQPKDLGPMDQLRNTVRLLSPDRPQTVGRSGCLLLW